MVLKKRGKIQFGRGTGGGGGEGGRRVWDKGRVVSLLRQRWNRKERKEIGVLVE